MTAIAEAFHPGEFLKEELEERGWSQLDLAEILGRPTQLVNELCTATRSVTPETARGLAAALGTTPEVWLRLQAAFDLHKSKETDGDVSRRSALYSKAPIREMNRRGWIESTTNIDVLEKQVCDFFEISKLEDEPKLLHAARSSFDQTTSAQKAWLCRARNIAMSLHAVPFTQRKLDKGLPQLKDLLGAAPETRNVSRVLAECGVRFVVVEPLPKTRIDGACFFLDAKSPVIAVSLRFDRVDSFWHTVAHELGHLKHDHDLHCDIDLQKNMTANAQEIEANKFAQDFLLPKDELDNFIARVRPLYSQAKIEKFAQRVGVHPGIVVGQLQFRGEIGYQHSRKLLEKVREYVTSTTLTDGWGSIVPA